MFTHSRRAGVENLVEALCQTDIRHVMTTIDERYVLRREHLREEPFEYRCASGRLGTGLDDHRVTAAHRRCYHADSEQNRKIERTNDQRDTIRHLIDLGYETREAHQPTEVPFGA